MEERQSGRTTRQLTKAVKRAYLGNNVAYVISSFGELQYIDGLLESICDKYKIGFERNKWGGRYVIDGIAIFRVVPSSDREFVDLIEMVVRGYPAENTFFDHYVWEVENEKRDRMLAEAMRRAEQEKKPEPYFYL